MSSERADANAAMERYARGDDAAFGQLYDVIAPRLWGYLMKRVRDESRAEDLMQQTLLHMHRARGRFQNGANVLPWMYSIAQHLLVDAFRRDGREVPAPHAHVNGVNGTSPADQVLAKELGKRIEHVLGDLPPRQRSCYELVKQEGLSHSECAQALGTTVSAVKSLMHRVLDALRVTVSEDREDSA